MVIKKSKKYTKNFTKEKNFPVVKRKILKATSFNCKRIT